jgi:hypothetical protein
MYRIFYQTAIVTNNDPRRHSETLSVRSRPRRQAAGEVQRLEARMDKAAKENPSGGVVGSRTNPFALDPMTPAQWLGMIEAQKQGNGSYFMNWNDRRLAINARLYVFDDGKAGSPTPTGAWNEGVPPTYRELARQVTELRLNQVAESQKFSQKLRRLFQNPQPGSTAAYGGMLPTLAGAMFIAEPRRNWRAWPINWMLLDFAELLTPYGSRADKHFTWDKILWHPEALTVDSGAPNPSVYALVPVKKPQTGPTGAGAAIGQIPTAGGLHRVGGKMPASPTGGGAMGGVAVGTNLNYIQQKEVSILVRWLAARNRWTALRATDQRTSGSRCSPTINGMSTPTSRVPPSRSWRRSGTTSMRGSPRSRR